MNRDSETPYTDSEIEGLKADARKEGIDIVTAAWEKSDNHIVSCLRAAKKKLNKVIDAIANEFMNSRAGTAMDRLAKATEACLPLQAIIADVDAAIDQATPTPNGTDASKEQLNLKYGKAATSAESPATTTPAPDGTPPAKKRGRKSKNQTNVSETPSPTPSANATDSPNQSANG